MPAARVYLSSSEIANTLSISSREAQYMLRMFEMQGKVVKRGTARRVYVGTLADWLAKQDGNDPILLKRELQAAVKPKDARKGKAKEACAV